MGEDGLTTYSGEPNAHDEGSGSDDWWRTGDSGIIDGSSGAPEVAATDEGMRGT